MNNLSLEESEIYNFWTKKAQEPKTYTKKQKKADDFFKDAPDFIKKNKEINLYALKNHKVHLSKVEPSIIDKEFILEYIKQNKYIQFYAFPKKFQEDQEIFFSALSKDETVFFDYKEKKDDEFIFKCVQTNPLLISKLSNKYKTNVELAKTAVDLDPKTIQFLSKQTTEKFCNNFEYCKILLEKNINAFPFLSRKIRNNLNFSLPYLLKKSLLITSLSKKNLNNPDLMLKFIKFLDFFLIFEAIGNDLMANEDFMLQIIKLYPSKITQIDKSLKNVDFFIKAVKANPLSYSFLPPHPEEFSKNTFIINALLEHDSYHKDGREEPIYNILNSVVLFVYKDQFNKEKNNLTNTDFLSFIREVYHQKTVQEFLENNLQNKTKKQIFI